MCFGNPRRLPRESRKDEQELPPDKRRILERIHEFLDDNEGQWEKHTVVMVRVNAIGLLRFQAPPPDHIMEYRDWVRGLRSTAALAPLFYECRPRSVEEIVKASMLLEKAWLAERMAMESGGGHIELKNVALVTDVEHVKHLFGRLTEEDRSIMSGAMRSAWFGTVPPAGV